MKIQVGVVGATGYTGMELLRILFQHPEVEIVFATSEKSAGQKLGAVFPFFSRASDLVLKEISEGLVDKCDVVFSCLPHKSAMSHIKNWFNNKLRIIDLSSDFRFKSEKTYEAWYEKHTAPELLRKAVYGLPELHRNEIKKARLVGNPGCYPTGAILGLAPLIQEDLIQRNSIIADSKSGVTGAGRGAAVDFLFSEVNDSIHAYKVGGQHRHTPEIEQELSKVAGEEIRVTFTPHLVPMDRGILSTLYASARKKTDSKKILQTLSNFYKGEPFVHVLPEGIFPKTKQVRGTNHCMIGATYNARTHQVIVVTAIDNLMKGAASQAVQNMNLMCGFEETTGLPMLPLVP